MFQFPRFPLPALCVQTGVTPLWVPGFPIRTSTDRSSVGSSPWLFAATRVLHRCQMPRHPPLALRSLEEQRCSCSLCSSQRAVCRHNRPTSRDVPTLRGRWRSPCGARGQRRLEEVEGSLPQNRREEIKRVFNFRESAPRGVGHLTP
jgi:hypothetical protein